MTPVNISILRTALTHKAVKEALELQYEENLPSWSRHSLLSNTQFGRLKAARHALQEGSISAFQVSLLLLLKFVTTCKKKKKRRKIIEVNATQKVCLLILSS